MAFYDLPIDATGIVPLIYTRADGVTELPAPAAWTIKSSDPSVVAHLADDAKTARLTPAGKVGDHAQVVIECGVVRDTLDVTITEARIIRVAFDVANATLEPLDAPPAGAINLGVSEPAKKIDKAADEA